MKVIEVKTDYRRESMKELTERIKLHYEKQGITNIAIHGTACDVDRVQVFFIKDGELHHRFETVETVIDFNLENELLKELETMVLADLREKKLSVLIEFSKLQARLLNRDVSMTKKDIERITVLSKRLLVIEKQEMEVTEQCKKE